MPAPRLLAAFCLLTVVAAVGLLEPRILSAVLAADAALGAAFLVDFLRARRAPLSARRRWPLLLVQAAAAEVAVDVASAGSRPVHVVLREGLHPALADRPLRMDLSIAPGGAAVWKYSLTPRRRGSHRLLPLSCRVLGPWGLAWAERELISPETVRVYPQVRWEGRAGRLLMLAQRRQLGLSPMDSRGLGSEPYGVRPYVRGDPSNRIHWKATARRGKLVTREDTWERGAHLVILLDCGRAMASVAGSRSKLDYALSAALALARLAAGRGDRVLLLAFSDRIERRVAVRSNAGEIGRAYAALFDLEARLAEPAYDIAVEAAGDAEFRRATVVLLTSVVDLASAELLRTALLRLRRQHVPLLVNLEDGDVSRLAVEEPRTELQAFAKVSALEILLGNRALTARLRHVGIRSVAAPADRLALETLESYLALFAERGTGARRLAPALRQGA